MTTAFEKSKADDRFFFLGNDLALDFLNTRPVLDGETVELLSEFDSLLQWLEAAGQISSVAAQKLRLRWNGSPRAARVAAAMHDLRERLRAAVLTWEGGKMIPRSIEDELNLLMADYPLLHRLTTDRGISSIEPWFKPEEPGDLFAPVAYAAARLFADADRHRVRKCVNCALHFRDTSKKGTRRWCSMSMCGNRSKVVAYANRHRHS